MTVSARLAVENMRKNPKKKSWINLCGQTFPPRTGTCLPFLHRFAKSLRWLRELWVARCPPSDLRDYSNLCWLIWLIRFICTRPQSSRRRGGTRRSLRNANKHSVLFLCLWGLWAFRQDGHTPPSPSLWKRASASCMGGLACTSDLSAMGFELWSNRTS